MSHLIFDAVDLIRIYIGMQNDEMQEPGYRPAHCRDPSKLTLHLLPEDIADCSVQSVEVPNISGITLYNNFHCRVQVTRSEERFSKTCVSVVEACYLYEAAILCLDRPNSLEEWIELGNYHSLRMMTMGDTTRTYAFYFFQNPFEFYVALGCWICYFYYYAEGAVKRWQDKNRSNSTTTAMHMVGKEMKFIEKVVQVKTSILFIAIIRKMISRFMIGI